MHLNYDKLTRKARDACQKILRYNRWIPSHDVSASMTENVTASFLDRDCSKNNSDNTFIYVDSWTFKLMGGQWHVIFVWANINRNIWHKFDTDTIIVRNKKVKRKINLRASNHLESIDQNNNMIQIIFIVNTSSKEMDWLKTGI